MWIPIDCALITKDNLQCASFVVGIYLALRHRGVIDPIYGLIGLLVKYNGIVLDQERFKRWGVVLSDKFIEDDRLCWNARISFRALTALLGRKVQHATVKGCAHLCDQHLNYRPGLSSLEVLTVSPDEKCWYIIKQPVNPGGSENRARKVLRS